MTKRHRLAFVKPFGRSVPRALIAISLVALVVFYAALESDCEHKPGPGWALVVLVGGALFSVAAGVVAIRLRAYWELTAAVVVFALSLLGYLVWAALALTENC